MLFLLCCLLKYMLSFFLKIYTINYMLKIICIDSSSRMRRRNHLLYCFTSGKQRYTTYQLQIKSSMSVGTCLVPILCWMKHEMSLSDILHCCVWTPRRERRNSDSVEVPRRKTMHNGWNVIDNYIDQTWTQVPASIWLYSPLVTMDEKVWKLYFFHWKWEITNLLLFLFCCLPFSFYQNPNSAIPLNPKIYTINCILKMIYALIVAADWEEGIIYFIVQHHANKLYGISITYKEFNECVYMVSPNSMLNETPNESDRYSALLHGISTTLREGRNSDPIEIPCRNDPHHHDIICDDI